MEEKKARDRALLLQTLYSWLQAASDLHKLADEAELAKKRARALSAPSVPGLSRSWAPLNPQGSLPEPIEIIPEAMTVFVDHEKSDLVMGALDVVATHRSTLKLWSAYSESRRRFNEKVAVKIDACGTYTDFSKEDVERHYSHLKELSDLADGICAMASEYSEAAKGFIKPLQEFIASTTGTVLDASFPDREGSEKCRSSKGDP